MADLTGAELNDADLTGTLLMGANLNEATLDGAKLDGAKLHSAKLDGTIWPRATAVPEGWKRDPGSGRLFAAGTGPP